MRAILLSIACGLSIPALGSASRISGLAQDAQHQVDENYDDQMSSSLHSTRSLLDAANETIVTQVSTFDELLQAMEDGYQDIEIMEHMDATSRGLITAEIQGINFKHQLPPQKSQTRSIRGACAEKPSADFLSRISGEPMLDIKSNQCVILSSQAVMPLAEGQVWFDNVYLRHAKASLGEAVVASNPPAPLHVHSGEAYITNVTIQGDGDSEVAGLWVFPSSNVLMIDSIIANAKLNIKDENSPSAYRRSLKQIAATAAGKAPPVVVIQAAPTFFLRTDFQDIDLPSDGHVVLGDQATNIKIQESTFTRITADRPLAAIGRAAFYSDDETLQVGNNAGGAAEPATPLALSRAAGLQPPHMTVWDDFFVKVQAAVSSASAQRLAFTDAAAAGVGLGVMRETPTTPSDGASSTSDSGSPNVEVGEGSDGGTSTSVIVGSIIAGAILIVGCIGGVLWYFNKKQRNAAKEKEKREAREAAQNGYGPPGHFAPAPSFAHQTWGPQSVDGKPIYGAPPNYDRTNYSNASSGAGTHPGTESIYGYNPPPGQGPLPIGAYAGGPPHYGVHTTHGSTPSLNAQSGMSAAPFPQATMTATNFDDFTYMSNGSAPGTATRSSNARTRDPGDPVGPMPEGASVEEKIERLHKQLDGMHAVNKPLLSHYEVLSHSNRRQGGQGVVQFARGMTDQLDYAIKFFVSKKAFDEEGDFYKNSPLGSLLPKCLALCPNDDNMETDAHNIPLPSFLIMEKGESLDEWSRRAKPDNFQAVAMLANIAKRLAHMHEAGFVHRDLKPGNVMWLPRENRWTVIDFGCVAKVGEPTTICYSLRYTSPEVIQALDKGQKDIIPQPSMDAWALGVMAYELLTGGPAFQILVDGPKQIISQLKGEAELPWEGERAKPEVMRKLRTLRRPVMALLERDPENRPSLMKFCDQCDDIFGTRTLKG